MRLSVPLEAPASITRFSKLHSLTLRQNCAATMTRPPLALPPSLRRAFLRVDRVSV